MRTTLLLTGSLLYAACAYLISTSLTPDWNTILAIFITGTLLGCGSFLFGSEWRWNESIRRWQAYTDTDYEVTRKEILDDYTPAERRAQKQEEREIYNTHAADGAFFAGATEYIDYDGKRVKL